MTTSYTTAQSRKPNIIYVLTDQLRHDMMGYSGNFRVKPLILIKWPLKGSIFIMQYPPHLFVPLTGRP